MKFRRSKAKARAAAPEPLIWRIPARRLEALRKEIGSPQHVDMRYPFACPPELVWSWKPPVPAGTARRCRRNSTPRSRHSRVAQSRAPLGSPRAGHGMPDPPTRGSRARATARAIPCCRRHWPASPPPHGSAWCGCRPRNAPSSRNANKDPAPTLVVDIKVVLHDPAVGDLKIASG
jgi:hypothetical protein